MKSLRLWFFLAMILCSFSKSTVCQIPDFSSAPNVNKGDSLNIVTLLKNGIKITREKIVCWFPKDSLSDRRMNEIADTLNLGIVAAEKFINAPLTWQVHPYDIPYTFYFRLDSIISHASMAGFVSISFWRIKEEKAPWLHEALHEMLFAKDNKWFTNTITDDFFDKNMPLWLSEGLPDYISLKVSQLNKLSWYDVFSRSARQNIDSLFIENMKSPNGSYIISHIGNNGVMPELSSAERQQYAPGFYHGSSSFVKFIAEHYGLAILLKAISSFQQETLVIEVATGKPIAELRKEWIKELKIPGY